MFVVLSAAFLASAQGSGTVASEGSRVVVQGWASVKSPPNIARISFDVRGDGSTSDQAVTALVAKSTAIEKALRSIDSTLDVHSESVRVQAVRPKDCEERDYDEAVHLATGECAIRGFVAVQDFNLRTARVGDAGTLVGLAGRRGAHNPKIESFGLADDREAKRNAIAKAMADARSKADAVAAGTGSGLGEIVSVSLDNSRERTFEIVVTGSRIPPPARERDDPVPVSVNPSPVETTAQVTVAYAIAR